MLAALDLVLPRGHERRPPRIVRVQALLDERLECRFEIVGGQIERHVIGRFHPRVRMISAGGIPARGSDRAIDPGKPPVLC